MHHKRSNSNSFHSKHNNSTLNIVNHILGLLFSFVGPLIVLLATRDHSTKRHARTALNWQFSLIVYCLVSIVIFVLGFFAFPLFFIGIFLFLILGVLGLVFPIIAAVRAGEGEVWSYPLAIRFFHER